MDTIDFENKCNIIPIKLKKKRGRKKKNFSIIDKSDEYSLLNVNTVTVGKKKRGRKPKNELDNTILATVHICIFNIIRIWFTFIIMVTWNFFFMTVFGG